MLTTHLHLALKSRKGTVTPLPPLGFLGLLWGEICGIIIIIIITIIIIIVIDVLQNDSLDWLKK